ncbi:MAG: FAD-dependent oxidoreductase [Pseudomonadota bacterium]
MAALTVAIHGAGVAGLCLSAELRARGVDVSVSDPAAGPGAHACSWWAGGMLAPGCEGESAPEAVERLGAVAADWWAAAGIEVVRRGTLVLAASRDRSELQRYARLTRGHRAVDADDIAALEPQLAQRFSSGLYFEDEAHLDPRQALHTLASQQPIEPSRERREGAGVQSVDCRGLAARDELDSLRGVRGEMLVLRCPEVNLSRPVRLLHPRMPLYIVPRGDHVYMVGATMVESDGRAHVSARALLELLSAAYAVDPAFAEAEVLEIGVDARPAFPDNLPRVVVRDDRVYLNGLFRHGYLMAPVLARQAADYLVNGVRGELVYAD